MHPTVFFLNEWEIENGKWKIVTEKQNFPRPCEELKMESGKLEIVTVYYYSELDSEAISFIGYIFWLVGATTSLMFFWIASHSLAMT